MYFSEIGDVHILYRLHHCSGLIPQSCISPLKNPCHAAQGIIGIVLQRAATVMQLGKNRGLSDPTAVALISMGMHTLCMTSSHCH